MMVVEPQGPQIKIEQARAIIEKLSFKSMSVNRVIVIDEAQTLNPQAANSLLKILEEPPENTFFFLIAPTQAALLATIRSRSRILQFKPVPESEMTKRSSAAAWMIKSSGGSFSKLEMLQEGPEQETRLKAVDLLQLFLSDASFLTNESWRLLFKDRAQAQKYLSYWISFIRDALFLVHGGKGQILNLDQAPLLKTLAQKGSPKLLSLLQKCLSSERALNGNQDSVLLLEKIWVTEKEEAGHVD
jgi:DNA polymerase-3 subunit delta'